MKPSPHQIAMLKMFSKGWRFKLYGNTAGTWRTYWALRNKGWCNARGAADVITPAGKQILERYGEMTTTNTKQGKLMDEDCTAIYNEANGIGAGKSPPISTERIFNAMRLVHSRAIEQRTAAPVEPVSDALPVVAEMVVAIEHEDYDNTKPAFTYTGISAIYREAEALPLGRHKLTDHAQATAEIAKRDAEINKRDWCVAEKMAEIAKRDAVVDELLKERAQAKRFVIAKHGNKGSASILRLALRELHQELDILRAELAKQTGVQELVEVPLNIIRLWPDGMAARLEHVWNDLLGFIPNYKLYDLQRMLSEYGFTMKLYENTKHKGANNEQ